MSRIRDPRQAVAIVSLGLMVPGADNPATFWDNIINNRTFFAPAQTEDWGVDPQLFFEDHDQPTLDRAYSLMGTWHKRPENPVDLKLPTSFDPEHSDASHLLWLTAGQKAMAEVSLDGHDPHEVGVIAGHVILPTRAMAEASVSFYGREATRAWELNPFSPPPKNNPFREVGYSAKLLSEALGLSGPAFTVDAACASSLYAIYLASQELLAGRLTTVISGGLANADPLFTQLGFSQLRALSRSGQSRPFSHLADGLVVGSGAVAVVLKRLDRAQADGDNILAVLLGVGLGNDRSSQLLAPEIEGQYRTMSLALTASGLKSTDLVNLGYIEAHGTATPLGDQVEISAIKKFLSQRPEGTTPVVGSVKSNLGHLLSASGAASLAKTILALGHKLLPPTAGFEKEAPGLNLSQKPALRILTQAEPWPEPKNQARLAAVNAFGFGGVNAQAILEEWLPHLWTNRQSKPRKPKAPSVNLVSARTFLAPWPSYESLTRFWLTPEEPPVAQTRRLGGLKATGFFFEKLTLDTSFFHLPPKELAEALPQQTLALKAGLAALEAAGLNSNWPKELDRNRVGIFMGVDIDPRAADYALRWLAPIRAVQALIANNLLKATDAHNFMEAMIQGGPPPLTHTRVLGALGSLVASRLSRHLDSGGPAFTLSEEKYSGLRALYEAIRQLEDGIIDVALVGVVDTFGDPKTADLAPRTVWVEGAVTMVLVSDKASSILKPLARLTLTERDSRGGSLSGLFSINRSAFYLRHHIKPLARGFSYWLRNPESAPRELTGPGFILTEAPDNHPLPLNVPADPVKPDVWFFLQAKDDEDLRNSLEELARLVEESQGRELTSLSAEFKRRQGAGQPALAILARDTRELSNLIKRALAGEEDRDLKPKILKAPPSPLSGEMAFVFPGSGNHYKGLGRGLGLAFPEVMATLESESKNPVEVFQSELFWEPNHKRPNPREAILAQVSFGLLGSRVLKKMDLHPQAVLGYSLGETTALIAMGLWPDRDELYQDLMESTLFNGDLTGELNTLRTFWHWPAHKPLHWTTALVPRSEETIKKAISELTAPNKNRAFILLVNTSEEVVIGGEESAIMALAVTLEAPLFPIEDVAAVHCQVIRPVLEEYKRFHTRPIQAIPNLRLYSSAKATAYQPTTLSVAESLTSQALNGHNFPKLVEAAYADGVRFFIEIGPGNSTTRMIKSILGDRPHLAQSLAATPVDEGWAGLSRLITELWLAGYPIDPQHYLYQPPPEPDPRYEITLDLEPPTLAWPNPADFQPPTPHAEEKPVENQDFLSWLSNQTTDPTDPAPTLAPEVSATRLKSTKAPITKSQNEPIRDTSADNAKPVSPIPPKTVSANEPTIRRRGRPKGAKKNQERLTREDCLEFATGRIEPVLGPQFAEVDSYPSRVRLPDEPLMFVDRVLTLEGQPLSLSTGRIVTEHDIRSQAFYLEQNRITPGMTIESGQADLLLSAWLGADFSTKGLANYRLLDAEVIFHQDLPKSGETARYDIRISQFFQHAATMMFRFEFDGTLNGRPLLTMRKGCAGFFTPEALKAGRGLGSGQPESTSNPVLDPLAGPFVDHGIQSLDRATLSELRQGNPGVLGSAFERLDLTLPLTLPSGDLALIDRVTEINRQGGAYGSGFIRAEADINPQAWFLTSHFTKDEVMPGTLMYDACLQTLRVYLLSIGWLGEQEQNSWQPPLAIASGLKCRGQVTQATRMVAYEVHIRELGYDLPAGYEAPRRPGRPAKPSPEPRAIADAIMWADGRPIVEVRNLGLRLAGSSQEQLTKLWSSVRKRTQTPKATVVRTRSPRRNQEDEFDKKRLVEMSTGLMSRALGHDYARFDDGSFVARLPKTPYDFIDGALVKGKPGQVTLGTTVEAQYNLGTDSWIFNDAGGLVPALPYAALNEIALQPCGFLAAYMGSSLPFPGPMHFRNLGGEATTGTPITRSGIIHTKATLTKASVLGSMTIQHYDFSCHLEEKLVYKGHTHFGFHTPEDLSKQSGLKVQPKFLEELKPPKLSPQPYPSGPAWPRNRWLMLDSFFTNSSMDHIWAKAIIQPDAWFFRAHFPGDPVCPGSLGLEAFLQAAKIITARKFTSGPLDDLELSWAAPSPKPHSWLYRGQIVPANHEMILGLKVTAQEKKQRRLTFTGLLWIDSLLVYKVDNFTVAAL